MSIKIWCEVCFGQGKITGENSSPRRGIKNWAKCPHCYGKGYIEKGCENCKRNNECYKIVLMELNEKITFCTAWKKKDE